MRFSHGRVIRMLRCLDFRIIRKRFDADLITLVNTVIKVNYCTRHYCLIIGRNRLIIWVFIRQKKKKCPNTLRITSIRFGRISMLPVFIIICPSSLKIVVFNTERKNEKLCRYFFVQRFNRKSRRLPSVGL